MQILCSEFNSSKAIIFRLFMLLGSSRVSGNPISTSALEMLSPPQSANVLPNNFQRFSLPPGPAGLKTWRRLALSSIVSGETPSGQCDRNCASHSMPETNRGIERCEARSEWLSFLESQREVLIHRSPAQSDAQWNITGT